MLQHTKLTVPIFSNPYITQALIINNLGQPVTSLSIPCPFAVTYHGYIYTNHSKSTESTITAAKDNSIPICMLLAQTRDISLKQCIVYYWIENFEWAPRRIKVTFGEWTNELPEVYAVFGWFVVTISRSKIVMLFEIQTNKAENPEIFEDNLVLRAKTELDNTHNPVLHCSLIHTLYRANDTFELQACVIKPNYLYLVNITSAGNMAMVKSVQMMPLCDHPLLPPVQVYYQGSNLIMLFTWPILRVVTFDKLNGVLSIRRLKEKDEESRERGYSLISLSPTDLLTQDNSSALQQLSLSISADHENIS